ncbi:UDP-N-acetylglucosamine--N-acetylmuramyl-(pentapeptide) pyrophosphoryl-undecaprenol N-acetylglucosamine transferase [Coraliomargarita sp. SDUM461003]|uniref:UDP-N-acetylglucosamine--N-acetylmuramyl-(pentapeptide) pyrophosphoryl-undecaprenol N-acetylglucosamine transferase n=1 Tax=Thalassobacterium maritimum TaxID=3041265 RepID=A0ABU1AX31_9BACT|nr:UDP-N-acetylglucosamine--N-acetylmuramyl-(pentapeptide) pyrophosphoryl-undecaprenol N-acetylglucosamine transferase [Coraliomargarita sp. SDUM461003]MBT63735.1 UDP-N-acetylglucosamine--N-acetylmuramyl-(pentapeptide) pyrophosphoryl-undecaprenol N-acetylglucosamine transferase [Puniceicoccaceae bacterium]MDQ8207695.1 UDP-N-acetylglucosamine--N-acetylmuramyl-(pentapeptide) pyrophosphoryl-undecaprenol N-acetylglucosamine transferase [Coraliomargarita sp. SDUM461003]HBR94154.1 UDP-N-acetylglucosam|tara:strand:+ start:4071 stop:5198 length:1128 start_codon:yes stop_codon:yes gene_type:complete
MSRIIIACGGTGGHLAPGIAVAEVLQERGHKCLLLISNKQVDSALVEKYSHLDFIKSPGRAFSGGVLQRLAFLASLFSSFFASRRMLREQEPDLVLLFGGFLSLGLGLAAQIGGVPVALHEANCQPGKAVRLIKHLSTRVYLPDGVRLKGVPPECIRYYGYPVRKEIKHALKVDAWKRLNIQVPNKLLVIIGGSQGASALNHWVTHNFGLLAKAGISIYCVTGLGNSSASTIHEIGKGGVDVTATLVPFSGQMGDVISAADLVVSRAGAGSIAEIIRCRAPAILVPYPYAADDHQYANALAHEQHGAGVLLAQDQLGDLTSEVIDLMFNDWLLAKFKSNLERLDRFESSERIADDLIALCDARSIANAEKLERVT